MFLVIPIAVLVALTTLLFILYRENMPIPVNVPGARFLLGHVHLLWNVQPPDLEEFILNNLHHPKHGDITHLKLLYSSQISLNTAETVQHLLRSSESERILTLTFPQGVDSLESLFADGLAVIGGDEWRKRRKILNASFHSAIMEGYEKSTAQSAKILVEGIQGRTSCSIVSLIEQVSALSIMETAIGMKYKNLDDIKPLVDSMNFVAHPSSYQAIAISTINSWFYDRFTKEGQRRIKALNFINLEINKILQERKLELERGETRLYKGHRSFLDLLVFEQAKTENLRDEAIIADCRTISLAGFGGVAYAMAFILYYLCKNQELQDRVYKEVALQLDVKSIESLEVSKLPYLTKFIKESMRLMPAAGFTGRHLTKPLNVNDITIPAGTDVLIAIKHIHRDPQQWESPDTFDPERFSPEKTRNRNPSAFIPFSAGPRNCIGMKVGMAQVKFFTAALVYHFEISTEQELGRDIFRCGNFLQKPGPEFSAEFKARG